MAYRIVEITNPSEVHVMNHQNRIKEFLPKTGCVRMFILTENQFSSCVLSKEVVDLQEYRVGSKDLVTL